MTFNAEFDALPGIGHACGHNLIATTSLGAFFAVVDALKCSGKPGRVRLLGTPAEESQGGKIKLVEAGAYKDVELCLMMHPTSSTAFPEGFLADAYDRTLAISGFRVAFKGKPAHAAIEPWKGVNALDAAIAAYNNIAVLRQQIQPGERIHLIIKEGGLAANIIPERSVVELAVRGPTASQARALEERVLNCFKGAALATGCGIEIEPLGGYADLRTNLPTCQAFQDAMTAIGHKVQNNTTRATTPASTDQGNVSYACPSWHGVFGIPTPNGAFPHTAGFADGAGTTASFEKSLLSCEGMALVGYRFLVDDSLANQVKQYFDEQKDK